MRPRNDKERRVVALSETLPTLQKREYDKIRRDFKRVYKNKGFCYYLVLERCKEFQVIRYYYVSIQRFFEFAQIWINNDTCIAMAKNRFMGVDNWIPDSDMVIKDWFRKGIEYTYLGGFDRIGWSGCVVHTVLPELRKRGLIGSTHNISPYKLCTSLYGNNRIETLFKLRQYRIVNYILNKKNELSETIWQAIRVALRHGYHWDSKEEVSDWFDMIDDLEYLGLDTRNPHYICPDNLSVAHTKWNTKARLKKFLDREMERVLAYEPTFKENREKFFDMTLTDNEISIQILKTAMDIVQEGAHMCHCVGNYYNRPDSLILTAKIDGKRVETIEVSLNYYTVVQSRGVQNKPTKYHDRIVKLVEDNMEEIKRRNLKKKVA